MVGMLIKMTKETYVVNNGTQKNQVKCSDGNNSEDVIDPHRVWPLKPNEVWEHFCKYTSAHGLSMLYGTCQWRKIFWGCVVIVAFTGLMTHINMLSTSYLRYHYTESAKESRSGYAYPDVTVCDLDGLSISRLVESIQTDPDARIFYQSLIEEGKSDHYDPLKMSISTRDFFNAVGQERAREYGHSWKDMILDCRFEGKPCKDEDWILFQVRVKCNFFHQI